MVKQDISLEYQKFEKIRHWKRIQDSSFLNSFMEKKSKNSKLLSYLYEITKEVYKEFPIRLNGEEALLHPLNIVYFLDQSGITDEETLCIGLIHDFIEEKVDLFREKKQIKNYKSGLSRLDEYEEEIILKLQSDLENFAKEKNIDNEKIKNIIYATRLLTRHKQDYYYRSIMNIFDCPNESVKEKVVQVKLADRMHNILCIECFNQEERTYQCFKNLFLLNNTKRFLIEKLGKDVLKNNSPTEMLFKKCCKATYNAFLTISYLTFSKEISNLNIRSIVHLAFKKFALERAGVWEVTQLDENEKHPIRLFQDIIRKYNYRLFHQWKNFEVIKNKQKIYVKKFFQDYNLSPEQIQEITHFKDAYALKEIIAYILYLPDYTISGFETADWFNGK